MEVFRGHSKLKNGLKAISDYRVVSPEVWALFKTLYGGGPILCQLGPDMYGPSVLKKKEELRKVWDAAKHKERPEGGGGERKRGGTVPAVGDKHSQVADRRHSMHRAKVAQKKVPRGSLLDTFFNSNKQEGDPTHRLKIMRERDREQRQMEIEEKEGYAII